MACMRFITPLNLVCNICRINRIDSVALQEVVRTLGGLDHLYLNHALMPQGEQLWSDAGDSLLEHHEKTMNINTNSYVFLYTAAFPHLLKSRDARVAVVSSIIG